MEILGAPFSALQLESARDLRNSLQAALERGAPLGGTERRIAEIEADAAFARGMAVLMPQDVDHRNLLIDIDMALRRGSRKSLPDPLFVKVVVEDWTEAMAADASQRPYLETAAELFRQGLQRITEEFRDSTREAYDESEFVKSMVSSKPFLGEPYSVAARLDYQAKSQRLQWSILSTLLPLLSPDQQDRVKNRLEFNYHWGTDSVVIELR
jgi:hypothetical protein